MFFSRGGEHDVPHTVKKLRRVTPRYQDRRPHVSHSVRVLLSLSPMSTVGSFSLSLSFFSFFRSKQCLVSAQVYVPTVYSMPIEERSCNYCFFQDDSVASSGSPRFSVQARCDQRKAAALVSPLPALTVFAVAHLTFRIFPSHVRPLNTDDPDGFNGPVGDRRRANFRSRFRRDASAERIIRQNNPR